MFYDSDGQPMHLENLYRGFPAFLLVNGPSLSEVNKRELSRPGVLTIGVNNGPSIFRPNLWIMGDDVTSFVKSIWLDPKIIKFAPRPKSTHQIWDNDPEVWARSKTRVGGCPGMVYFTRNEHFQPDKFLTEDTVCWGNHSNRCICGWMRPDPKKTGKKKVKQCPKCGEKRFGSRTVMHLAFKIAYVLGIRTLYIVGADFKMTEEHTYAFEQARASGSINNNRAHYAEMNKRFDVLRPIFEAEQYHIYNCTPDSGLKSFDSKPLQAAIDEATAHLGPPVLDVFERWVIEERTQGLYDRKAKERKAKEDAAAKAAKDGKPTMRELEERLANE